MEINVILGTNLIISDLSKSKNLLINLIYNLFYFKYYHLIIFETKGMFSLNPIGPQLDKPRQTQIWTKAIDLTRSKSSKTGVYNTTSTYATFYSFFVFFNALQTQIETLCNRDLQASRDLLCSPLSSRMRNVR